MEDKPPPQTTKVQTMTNSRPSRRDLQAFSQAMEEAKQAPRITEAYLTELARKRDQYFAYLAR